VGLLARQNEVETASLRCAAGDDDLITALAIDLRDHAEFGQRRRGRLRYGIERSGDDLLAIRLIFEEQPAGRTAAGPQRHDATCADPQNRPAHDSGPRSASGWKCDKSGGTIAASRRGGKSNRGSRIEDRRSRKTTTALRSSILNPRSSILNPRFSILAPSAPAAKG